MQGDPGDLFYIIKEGEAVVYQSTPQGTRKVNHLFKADFFGERALLCDEPRSTLALHSPFLLIVSVSSTDFSNQTAYGREALEIGLQPSILQNKLFLNSLIRVHLCSFICTHLHSARSSVCEFCSLIQAFRHP